MFVLCPAQLIPGSNTSILVPQEEANSFYLAGAQRERQTETIWRNTQLQPSLELRIPKVREVVHLSARPL